MGKHHTLSQTQEKQDKLNITLLVTQQQPLPTLSNLATRSQTWNLFRWNYNPLSACHTTRQEIKHTS